MVRGHKVDGMDFPRVYFEYQDYLLRSRRMDYDDQMVFTYRIFRQKRIRLLHDGAGGTVVGLQL